MSRTTSALVGGIIDVESGFDVSPFITVANELVTEVCAAQKDSDGSDYYTSARLTLIETWLSAHFYAIYDPRAVSESAGPVSQNLQSKVDLGLDVTHYGQMAMRLDTAGGLTQLNEATKKGTQGKAYGVTWLGKDPDNLYDE